MKIRTKYHGEMNINEEEILRFEKGIPGFPNETRFVLIPLTDDGLFQVLQSTVNEEIAFITTDPFFYKKDYDFVVDDAIVESLGIEQEKDVKVFVIITPKEPFNQSTANLQAPIVINTTNNKARQIILNNTNYLTKHPLFAEEPVTAKGR
ncbi:flagellar assembly protein FliW [Niallia endozanthoxylica]|uniref:Flagellar assembly factor FliW n=1 Tax=Niallia endozanthoxylica TaxID=2036016 RepID=A0A5J5HNH7_9BACI|nr:flagellar assembly protein FliW [Niallia endozanthoxylica]KAA9022053.1 flagellar assembly protein FliW [Niallia endozanthoxylica]